MPYHIDKLYIQTVEYKHIYSRVSNKMNYFSIIFFLSD